MIKLTWAVFNLAIVENRHDTAPGSFPNRDLSSPLLAKSRSAFANAFESLGRTVRHVSPSRHAHGTPYEICVQHRVPENHSLELDDALSLRRADRV